MEEREEKDSPPTATKAGSDESNINWHDALIPKLLSNKPCAPPSSNMADVFLNSGSTSNSKSKVLTLSASKLFSKVLAPLAAAPRLKKVSFELLEKKQKQQQPVNKPCDLAQPRHRHRHLACRHHLCRHKRCVSTLLALCRPPSARNRHDTKKS